MSEKKVRVKYVPFMCFSSIFLFQRILMLSQFYFVRWFIDLLLYNLILFYWGCRFLTSKFGSIYMAHQNKTRWVFHLKPIIDLIDRLFIEIFRRCSGSSCRRASIGPCSWCSFNVSISVRRVSDSSVGISSGDVWRWRKSRDSNNWKVC